MPPAEAAMTTKPYGLQAPGEGSASAGSLVGCDNGMSRISIMLKGERVRYAEISSFRLFGRVRSLERPLSLVSRRKRDDPSCLAKTRLNGQFWMIGF